MTVESVKKIPDCPKCGKSYGVNIRVDNSLRCRLCGYDSRKEEK